MRKNRAFAATAIVTIALGIAGNTAMFTVIRAVLLKPLAYRDPDRLVRLSVDQARLNLKDVGFSQIRFEQMQRAQSFAELGAFFIATENMTLSGGDEPEALKGARVSANFLSVLGVAPMLGRGFLPEEDQPGGRPVAMISADLWRRHFGGDPRVAGKTATLEATPYTIVGVLPQNFQFPQTGVDVWVTRPSEFSAIPPNDWRVTAVLVGIGRLKPGASLDQARAEMEVLGRQYAATSPRDAGATMRLTLLQDQMVANVRPMLLLLSGAVGFVLLIACANVASLLLARATSRSSEFAIRAALGAARGRLMGQLLAESMLLAVAGGTLGVLLAKWGLTAITSSSSLGLPRVGEIRLDASVLGFSLALSILTGILFGLFPSLNASRPDLAHALRAKDEGTNQTSTRRAPFGLSARSLLVVGQAALSIILLIGTSLLLESFARIRGVDPGFRPANLLTLQIALPTARYTGVKQRVFFEELVRRVETLPGVRGASVMRTLPTTARYATPVAVQELPPVNHNDWPQAQLQTTTPGYFHTMGIAVRRGRDFNDRDRSDSGFFPVIINESLVRLFWPGYPSGQEPVGRHLLLGAGRRGMEIVGIVADVHERGLDGDVWPEVYVPFAANPLQTASLAVRTDGDPRGFVNSVRAQVLAIDRDQAISNVRTMDEIIDGSIGQRRVTLVLLGLFAGAAVTLAMVGLYGVIAYSVTRRTRELGIRRALGAQQRDILGLVLRQGLSLALTGVAIGIGGALALTRLMTGFLFHVSATDPATFAGIALLFVLIALAASYIPARRATSVDPMDALR